jgi:hypothetical protein
MRCFMQQFFRGLMIAVVCAAFGMLINTSATAAQDGKQVWAFYFGWWTGDSWGDGRLIDRPAAPYDSRDGGAVGRQIDEAKGAGIDAFIMSWYGPKDNNLTHQVFNMLLDQANARGFRAAVALDMGGSYNGTTGEVIESLNYVINDRANHGGYLRYNGKPVIYFWNQGRFSAADWANIRAQVDPNHNTIWVAEGTNTGFLPTFDGLYLFNTAWSGNPGATASQWYNNTVAAGGWFYTPTVNPGWDESRMEGRANPTDPQDRGAGQFLANSWNGAANSGAGVILIVSWNEYFENSHIEPSQNFGATALDTLRPLVSAWKSSQPAPAMNAPAAPEAITSAEQSSGGAVTYAPYDKVRLRGGPSTATETLTSINYGETLQPIGRNADGQWLQVNYNGQTGWVAGWVGQVSGDVMSLPVTG